jgi:hypothetical protein
MSRTVSTNLGAYVLILVSMIGTVRGGDHPSNENVRKETIPCDEPLAGCLQDMQRAWQEYHTAIATPDQKLNVIRATRQLYTQATAKLRLSTEQFVRTCDMCAGRITSEDFGKDRFELSQQILTSCLPYLEAVPTKLAVNIVCKMSVQYDLQGQPLTKQSVPTYRNTYVRYHLRAWERVVSDIDPTWKPGDRSRSTLSPPGGKYLPGTPPEDIKEPDIRSQYEAMLEANRKKADRNLEQRHARRLHEFYLPRLKSAIADVYHIEPVSEDDFNLLKAYLRIYVSHEGLRKELFEIAQSAAKGKHGEQTKSSSVEKE